MVEFAMGMPRDGVSYKGLVFEVYSVSPRTALGDLVFALYRFAAMAMVFGVPKVAENLDRWGLMQTLCRHR
jgi:hypothetical protein